MNTQTIVNGPSKFDLMVALFVGAGSKQQNVRFQIKETNTLLEVRIQSVEREDGSGESWCFTGMAKLANRTIRVAGYFQTERRTGTIHEVV